MFDVGPVVGPVLGMMMKSVVQLDPKRAIVELVAPVILNIGEFTLVKGRVSSGFQ